MAPTVTVKRKQQHSQNLSESVEPKRFTQRALWHWTQLPAWRAIILCFFFLPYSFFSKSSVILIQGSSSAPFLTCLLSKPLSLASFYLLN